MRVIGKCPACMANGLAERHTRVEFSELPPPGSFTEHEICGRTIVVGHNLELIAEPVGVKHISPTRMRELLEGAA